jgi:hypothetical protein
MKKINLIYLFLTLLMVSSCEKSFLKVNTDPNSPTDVSITSDLLLPSALVKTSRLTTGAPVAGGNNRLATLARWCGVWCPTTDFAAGEESKYIQTAGTSNQTWFTIYDQNIEFKSIENKSKANGETFYQGISLIMQSLNYQMAVDMFNDIPYSQATDPTILAPKYDKAEVIYLDLLKKIDEGITLIKAADASKNFNLSTGDVLISSSASLNTEVNRKLKWIKLANTLKLRLLIHMSQLPNITTLATAEIAKINTEGSGYIGAGETISVNPGFITAKPNHFWAAYIFDQAGNSPNTFNRANNFSLNALKSLNDVRYQYFYKPVAGTNGTSPNHWVGIDYAPTNSSPTLRANVTSDIGGAAIAAGGTTGLGKSATMDAWIFTAAESLFLQAEAKARGWDIAGTALALYQSGVIESFNWLGVTVSIPNPPPTPPTILTATQVANIYLSQSDPRVSFGTSLPDNLRAIAWQKYFAFNGNNFLEIWNDYRRLDIVPIPLSLDPGRGNNGIPVRFPYPQTELDFNSANVNAAGGGGLNIFTSKIFWDK